MRWVPSSRMVPAGSSAFATATSSSARSRTIFSVSAYVAMECLRGKLYRIAGGSVTSAPSVGTGEQTAGNSRQRARQGGPGGDEPERRRQTFGQIRNRSVRSAPIDAASLVRIREQEAMIGEDVDDPRYPSGESREATDRPRVEQADVR